MSKLRIKTRFATVPVDLTNDKNVSLKAKGLYAYLQSKPDDWDFSLRGIVSQLKEGLDAVREAVKELEVAGFLQRTNYQNDKGQWDCDYELFDTRCDCTPLTKNPSTEKPYGEKPYTENSETVKPPHLVKKNISKKEEVKYNTKEKIYKKENPPFKFLEEVENVNLQEPQKTMLKEFWSVKKGAKTKLAFDILIRELNKLSAEIQIIALEKAYQGKYASIEAKWFDQQPQKTNYQAQKSNNLVGARSSYELGAEYNIF